MCLRQFFSRSHVVGEYVSPYQVQRGLLSRPVERLTTGRQRLNFLIDYSQSCFYHLN